MTNSVFLNINVDITRLRIDIKPSSKKILYQTENY